MGFEGVSLTQRSRRVAVAVKLTAPRAKGGATAPLRFRQLRRASRSGMMLDEIRAGIGHLTVKPEEIEPEIVRVKPSSAFRLHRDEIRRLVQQSRASNPRMFGSVLRGRDTESRSVDSAAVSAIRSIIDDERAHCDRVGFESTAGLFWPGILRPLVSWATETVIWLGMRL
jgi:hypothetical protein